MKMKILAVTVFTFTVVSILFYPFDKKWNVSANNLAQPVSQVDQIHANRDKIELVFVLDTTGSMSGLIDAAKEKIWSIATTMASAQSSPEIKIGLVAYRDRGDEYVTKIIGLSQDLDSMYSNLMDFNAGGGGDGPESVNKALFDAVNNISWSQDKDVYKVIFLVGDAPPHMDYKNEVRYPAIIKMAYDKDIIINTIQSGGNQMTRSQWMRMASLGQGEYFQVGHSGNTIAVSTPFDRKMAFLSKKLDDTRLYYGTEAERKEQQLKVKATDKLHSKASITTRARRAEFNVQKSGESNRLGKNELVDDISSGRVNLETIDKDKLPSLLQDLSHKDQLTLIQKREKIRNTLIQEIRTLGGKRKEYIKEKIKTSGTVKSSLDEKIYKTIRKQAAKKGLKYKEDSAAY